jgi:hypothetical protein
VLFVPFCGYIKIMVLPEPDLQSEFPGIKKNRLFGILCQKTSFGDAL